ncbi:MAG: amino acid--[acyl-carrier-protein] ligase [Myxococcota bacterium]
MTVSERKYDSKEFFDGLVAHGLIMPVDSLGAFGRSAVFEDVLDRFNALVTRSAIEDGAIEVTYPPIIDRSILEKVDYLDSFPQLCGCVHSFFGNDKEARALSTAVHAGESWGKFMAQTDVVLTPAACYPLYPHWAGKMPPNGRLVSLMGWVYRHEPSEEPTRMQAFRVREFIKGGHPEEVVVWRDKWLERGMDLLRSLQLPVRADVAADPFFGRAGKMMMDGQKAQKLKFEVLVPVISEEDPTAICSFNYHQDKFGKAFGIQTADGEVAHTACLGFGMERVVMALFKEHGFKPEAWPQAVRSRLWP